MGLPFNIYTDQAATPATRPSLGLSDYVMENLDVDAVQISFSFAGLGTAIDSTYYFIIHTALATGAEGTSVSFMAGDNPVSNGKGAWYYVWVRIWCFRILRRW